MSNSSIIQLFEHVSVQLRAIDDIVHLARDVVASEQSGEEPGNQALDNISRLSNFSDNLDQDLDQSFQDLRYRIDLANLLYNITEQLAGNSNVDEVINLTVDAIWQQIPLRFIAAVSGESELGPYIYRSMRGISGSGQYVGEICSFPLWGLLARALLPRLDPDESNYLIVNDVDAADNMLFTEFPWLEKRGALAIFPLRVDDTVVGGLLLGREQADAFDDTVLCQNIETIASSVARSIWQARMRHEMIGRASQVVGLQLFTRAIATVQNLDEMLEMLSKTIPEVIGSASVFLIFVNLSLGEERDEQVPRSELIDNLDIYLLCDADNSDNRLLSPQILELAVWVFQAAQPVFFDPHPIVEDNTILSPEDLFYNEEGYALLVPVMIGNEILSVFYVSSTKKGRRFNEDDMVVLRTMTNSIASVLARI